MHKMDAMCCKRQLNSVVDLTSLCTNNLLYAYENYIDNRLLLKPSRLRKDEKRFPSDPDLVDTIINGKNIQFCK
jgi:hypothetical protein